MRKLLFLFMTLPILMCSQVCTLPECLCEADMVKAYQNGQEIIMEAQEHAQFIEYFKAAIADCREAPAFCVSLHEDTMKGFETGIWIKFVFNETQIAREMPFDSILMHIEKDSSGINLIRGNQGVYNGRCFYLDLEHNFNDMYDFLITLPTVENPAEEVPEVELDASEQAEETMGEIASEEPEETPDGASNENEIATGAMPSKPDDSEKENNNGVIRQTAEEENMSRQDDTNEKTKSDDENLVEQTNTEKPETALEVEKNTKIQSTTDEQEDILILKAVDAKPVA